jgi:hypothetical protein
VVRALHIQAKRAKDAAEKMLKRKIKKAMLEHCNNPSGKLPRGRERGKGGERTALNKAMI